MAHPSDAALHITLGREIDKMIQHKVLDLIAKPTERTAGYIQALRDVQAIMHGDGAPAPDLQRPHPGETFVR